MLQFVHFVLCSVLCSFPLPARARLQRSQLGFCAVQPCPHAILYSGLGRKILSGIVVLFTRCGRRKVHNGKRGELLWEAAADIHDNLATSVQMYSTSELQQQSCKVIKIQIRKYKNTKNKIDTNTKIGWFCTCSKGRENTKEFEAKEAKSAQ